jgi:hypothetical protein
VSLPSRPADSSSDMTSPPETAFTEDAALDEDEFDTQSLPALAGWVVGQLLGELATAALCSSRVSLCWSGITALPGTGSASPRCRWG